MCQHRCVTKLRHSQWNALDMFSSGAKKEKRGTHVHLQAHVWPMLSAGLREHCAMFKQVFQCLNKCFNAHAVCAIRPPPPKPFKQVYQCLNKMCQCSCCLCKIGSTQPYRDFVSSMFGQCYVHACVFRAQAMLLPLWGQNHPHGFVNQGVRVRTVQGRTSRYLRFTCFRQFQALIDSFRASIIHTYLQKILQGGGLPRKTFNEVITTVIH